MPCSGAKSALLGAAGSLVRTRDLDLLDDALRTSGLVTTRTEDGALRVDAEPAVVGLVVREHGLALTELRAAGDGLEEMFLRLTAEDAQEGEAA